ncbi:hypothetical protein EST38_g12535 [Candolleomyces aberdarensis]|uniref:Uncharacterized protein n=1 Tax=Candolleomyces aberdarensis TaxID=2316362 RepID=A0A4Q2D274_9AGAR|nr:hypothetical protein EST38_g12535 [Candolleomyces aberdarensis]
MVDISKTSLRCLIAAINIKNIGANKAKSKLLSKYNRVPQTAPYYRDRGIGEHAALELQFLGDLVTTTRCFTNPANYDKTQPNGLDSHHPSITTAIPLAHTFSEGQIKWFKTNSALSLMAAKAKAASLPLSLVPL